MQDSIFFCKSLGFSNLPVEILHNVFAHCDSEDLKRCALTCHSWKYATRSLLFPRVKIGSMRELDNLAKLTLKGSAIGTYVKRLTFSGWLLDFQTLYCVSQLFKNIRSISFKGDEMTFDNLYYLLSVGEFSCLRMIPGPEDNSQDTSYLNCVNALKHRIEYIELSGGGTYEPLLGKLNIFSNLKSIYINFSNSIPSSATSILEAVTKKSDMQSLKQIELSIHRSFPSNNLSTEIEKV